MHGRAHPPDERITVLLAAANTMGGQLIAGALKRCGDKFDIVGSTSSYADAVQIFEAFKPHVAVISTALEDGPMNGFRVLQRIQTSGVNTAVVMLMDRNERELVVDSFRGGAKGVFCRGSSVRNLSKCIRTVHSGQLWVSNDQLMFLLDLITRLKPLHLSQSKDMRQLTRREADVVRLVTDGMKNSDIARELHVAEHTVRNYLYRVFDKLGLSSRVELVLHALARGESVAPPHSLELHR
jgi:two-component system nitrate/nitrite response regulator NarL